MGRDADIHRWSTRATRRLFLPVVGMILVILPVIWQRHHLAASPANPVPPEPISTRHPNALVHSTSPYLLEHAYNPVNWYPWGDEALSLARREKKPIFLSIGYSACHWCHVMAREDFENAEIAKILNDHFVCIKVDREQRPDLDSQYMMAVQMMTGSGGWPLSVFLMPDQRPFFGGTYFPPDEFKTLLLRVVDLYTSKPQALQAQADQVAEAIARATAPAAAGALPPGAMTRAINNLVQRYDRTNGGFSDHPKFPDVPSLLLLLNRYRASRDPALLKMVTGTLDHMAAGGIYDHLGGGFHRYSTDSQWRVPHFEKMLYDQALLARVYLETFRVTGKPLYRSVAAGTLDFVIREMHDPAGGFESSLDADSEGQEGKYYLWTPAEVETALGADAPLVEALYGVTAQGDIDGNSVLHLAKTPDSLAKETRIPLETLQSRVSAARTKLMAARNKRIRPATDDKILASWNGLMISAFALGFQVLGDTRYRQTAENAARFLLGGMTRDGVLMHTSRAGTAEVPGMLEDYACTAGGLLDLYDATRDRQWLEHARELATRMLARFEDPGHPGFYTTAAQADLIARRREPEDNIIPSAEGIAAQALVRLSSLTGDPSWRERAVRAMQSDGPAVARAPGAFPTLLVAFQMASAADGASRASKPVVNRPLLVQVTGPAATVRVRSGSTSSIVLTVSIANGWHINAHRPSESYLIPTSVTLVGSDGASLAKVEYPAGQSVKFSYSPRPLSVYKGQFSVTTVIKVPASTKPGARLLRLQLTYQPCNDRSCGAPGKQTVEVPLEITGS